MSIYETLVEGKDLGAIGIEVRPLPADARRQEAHRQNDEDSGTHHLHPRCCP